jgi:tetratricopeptide (TPR) repeat protein
MENLTHGEGRTPQMPASRPKRARGSAASLFARARRLHDAGHLEKAAREYRAVLAREPRHLDALHLLGVARLEAGDYPEAIELIGKAIAEGLQQPEVLNNLGIAQLRQGNAAHAMHYFEQAIELRSGYAEAHANKGTCLMRLERFSDAAHHLASAIQINPSLSVAYKDLAIAMTRLGDHQGALRSIEGASALEPENALLHRLKGDTLVHLGMKVEALASYREALRLDPGMYPAYVNIGNLLSELGHFDLAVKTLSHLIKLDNSNADALISRGSAFMHINLVHEAHRDFARALEIAPRSTLARHNLSVTHSTLGEPRQALELLDQLILTNPESQRDRYTRSLLLLVTGELPAAWEGHEARHALHNRAYLVEPRDRLWDGKESVAGKTMLLKAEQGLGDTIQFCRYATLVAGMGARVVLAVPPPLKKLMMTLEGVSEVISSGDDLPGYDLHCPLLSLPRAFGTSYFNIPAKKRYLSADQDAVAAWSALLPANGRKRVGLVWNGGFRLNRPDHWGTNERRNIPMGDFFRILDLDHDFYTLQKGDPAESEFRNHRQLLWPHSNLLDFTSRLHDFSDTAALVENLDLVISVDTSTAHLAAALGKPVWLLNRHDTCWRWFLQRSDSPWYPSLRIFRQTQVCQWDDVIESVKSELRKTEESRTGLPNKG